MLTVRSGTGSNDPVPLLSVHLVPFNEDSITVDTQPSQPVDDLPLEPVDPQCTQKRNKGAVKKKLTPKKLQ